MSKLIPSNRRNFVRNAAVGTIAALAVPGIISSAFASASKTKKVTLGDNDVVLFQGDSITEWGRDKSKSAANDFGALGSGYVLLTATVLLRDYAAKNLQIHNTGISGNKVYQLADRWDTDTVALKPNVLSIMVGVNDYWHTLSGNYKGTIETYRTDYKKLLDRTKQALPDAKLIIGEPFALKDVKAVDASWYPAFDTYRQAAQDVADEFEAVFVPYQKVMDEAVKVAPAKYWSIDGVHPSPAGASLMAEAWLKAVKG
ncbi:SGNH/GDSL hydrolase family protein [Mucilaginibacter sp. X5P1]|uniref:SGNH/GDSL hydrolase family protein n=1 Tax=Mucilaginibacter sp. X5P1 TaxID=2723088 RepID=UPI001610F5B1|nr:SGNH/GDSL hydrolase family protein [Mucilaginibacter sp. X5P1]MBB6141755.1 lysophospholipase L1-like esterase [Mucilaginibacter sp. X5P1]